jgi:hypothetical protein
LKNGNPGGINYKELNEKFENTLLSYSLSPAGNSMSASVQGNQKNTYTTSYSASLPYNHHRPRITEQNSTSFS